MDNKKKKKVQSWKFKQKLICTWLNFENDDFDNTLYFLNPEYEHFIKQFCLKIHSSLNNIV